MNNIFGLSNLKSFGQLKSLPGSSSGAGKTLSISSRASSDSYSLGSFANLKLTAEKLVKEQASAKTDLSMANTKLKKLTEHIRILEEKLQNAFNENAKLKVKKKEDEKLWNGLESKLSSTKTYCDQLTETLHLLAGQVQDAEKDRQGFEEKISASSVTLDNLHDRLKSLFSRLESSEEAVRNREKELGELRSEKEKLAKAFNSEQTRAASLLEEKDVLAKNFEATIAARGLAIENLNSELEKLHLDLSQKEDALQDFRVSKEKLDKEKDDLLIMNKEFTDKLDKAAKEIQNYEELVHLLSLKFIALDSQSLTISEKVFQLSASFETCLNLAQEEKHVASQLAQQKFDKLLDKSRGVLSGKNALELVNQELNTKIIELQKEQEFTMVKHAEECRLAEQSIWRLKSEEETLVSKKIEMEMQITQLKEKVDTLSEDSSLSEKKMQDLLLQLSELEISNKNHSEKLEANVNQKQEEIDVLKKEIEKHEEHVDLLEKQVSQLTVTLEENSRLVMELKDRAKQLEDQKAEIQASLTDAETKLTEAKKKYDQMLEGKQLELSRHLKEISQKNDQAINDIRRRYELEKMESINLEKEKTDKVVREMEKKFEQKLEESKEESRQYLLRVNEEHAALISRIQQEHDKKELYLMSNHAEELKRAQLQAENDLRENTVLLQNEHEEQLKALRGEHEDELRRVQEELDVQKSKEERQKALLQLQWKVMSDNPQDDQEVNSKKTYSISSSKVRNSESGRRGHHPVQRTLVKEKVIKKVQNYGGSPYLRTTHNTGSAMNIPKHSRKVTHREYEVETSNCGTITKRRKTKSTVMFADPKKRRKGETPVSITPIHLVKETKRQGQLKPSNIGDLFSEGSLNPYADDPYAFD